MQLLEGIYGFLLKYTSWQQQHQEAEMFVYMQQNNKNIYIYENKIYMEYKKSLSYFPRILQHIEILISSPLES